MYFTNYFFFNQKLSKIGILHLENKQKFVFLLQHVAMAFFSSKGDRSPFLFSFDNTIKNKKSSRFFKLKLCSLVAEYFEEKQM